MNEECFLDITNNVGELFTSFKNFVMEKFFLYLV